MFDTRRETLFDMDGRMAVHREQEIPDDFLEHLSDQRAASAFMRRNELHQVASVPTALIEIWQRQGFDFHNATAREIVQKLKSESLDAFVTTSGRV